MRFGRRPFPRPRRILLAALLCLPLPALSQREPPPPGRPETVPAPNILDELDTIQLVTEPWESTPPLVEQAPAANPMAGTARWAREPDYSFSGFTAPALAQEDLAARALDETLRDTAPPSFEAYPKPVRSVDFNDPLPAWILGTPGSLAGIPPLPSERRALGILNAPNFLKANRSLALGAGRVRYAIEVDGQASYASNVFGIATDTKSDFVFSLQPAIYMEAGNRLNVRFLYMPTLVRYSKYKEFDAFNQSFLFSSRFRASKLRLGLDVSYITQSGLFLSSIGQARQRTLIARLTASYPLGRKTEGTVFVEAGRVDSNPGGVQNQASFTADVDYRWSPKTRFGTGVTVGAIRSPAGTTTYQTFLVRLLYTPTSKLFIKADGGLQFRQSSGVAGSSSTISTAVLSAILTYRPTAKTTLSMRFFRTVDVDAFTPGNLQTLTGIEGTISWKISTRAIFDANLLAGSSENETLSGDQAGDYLFAQGTLSLSYLLLDDVNVRVFTSLQRRLRDTQSNNYLSSTSGMSLGMRF